MALTVAPMTTTRRDPQSYKEEVEETNSTRELVFFSIFHCTEVLACALLTQTMSLDGINIAPSVETWACVISPVLVAIGCALRSVYHRNDVWSFASTTTCCEDLAGVFK